jgi:hypothetical protein
VRYRLMATYRGSPFEAGIGPSDGDIVLFAACPPPEDLGFEPATGHWRKQLPISEVQAVWESRPVGTFRGERCMVLDDLGDRLHIGYLGHDGYQAEQLGYWQVDRGVFELVAARSEVSDITEERTEYPRHLTAVAGPETAVAQEFSSPPPGAPQDQAQYLPPEPQEQASYLLGRPDYFRAPEAASYPPEPSRSFAPTGPASGQYSWPDPDSWPDPGQAAQYPSGPVFDRGAPLAQPGQGYPVSPERGAGIAVPALAEPPLPLETAAGHPAARRRSTPRGAAFRRAASPRRPASSRYPASSRPGRTHSRHHRHRELDGLSDWRYVSSRSADTGLVHRSRYPSGAR